MTTTQTDKAVRFRTLHTGGDILVLPNAWDVASARVIERAGAAAIATTSAGVAWSLGAPDGDHLARGLGVELVARVAGAVSVPVTADIENGYASDPKGVADTVEGIIAAGAVGVNLEDGDPRGEHPLRPATEHAERVAAARAAADASGVPLYVNARVDTYLMEVGDPAGRLDETLRRAAAYVEAGADGIFVPGVTDLDTVSALAKSIGKPLNVLAGPGAPAVAELARCGAARVSVGASIARVAYAAAQRAAEELLSAGTYGGLAGGLAYGELNALLAKR